jgi:hypothetical protein
MKRITLFVLLLFMELNLFNQNLIVNPGFEVWENTIKPSGWSTVQNCLKDSVYFKTGSYSCQHSGGTSASKYLGQTLAVVSGKQYGFSFFFRTEITGTANGCRIWCYWKDAGGNNIPDPLTDAVLRPSKYMKSDNWQQFSTVVVAPALGVNFYLEVRTYPNSIAYLDDFVFEESAATFTPEEKFPEIMLYPNPAHDYLIINNTGELQRIIIKSLAGINVWASNFSGEAEVKIPVSGLPAGIYIISIMTSDKAFTRKFIKNEN